MKINKETLRRAFEEGKSSKLSFDAWYKKLNEKKKEVVLEGDWVDLKVEKPIINDYYVIQTNLSDQTIADWWTGTNFTFNDGYVVKWKRKQSI
jgi:hypothetical protein